MGQCNTKFKCGICFENRSSFVKKYFRDCKEQEHFCCKRCMKRYVKDKILNGVVDINCPFPNCTSHASEKGIMSCLSRKMIAKYKRFKRIKEDPTYRECPKCGKEMVFDVESEEMLKACDSCGAFSCFVHGGAHEGHPCEEYVNQEDTMSNSLIQRICQRCPVCAAVTEKISGCNHLRCTMCGNYWQWAYNPAYVPAEQQNVFQG